MNQNVKDIIMIKCLPDKMYDMTVEGVVEELCSMLEEQENTIIDMEFRVKELEGDLLDIKTDTRR